MDNIAGTGLDKERTTDSHPSALLVIVLDTNPYAWNELSPHITLSKAVSELLVFINAHLAFNHANRVAVLASHCHKASWLYPSSPLADTSDAGSPPSDPNKYRHFALVEHELLHNLRTLLDNTTEADILASPTSSALAGALTLGISYISKLSGSSSTSSTIDPEPAPSNTTSRSTPSSNARILIVSTSGDLASQYISLMNLIFASQHLRIPLDILKLAGDTVLLQQASYTTSGVFLIPATLAASSPDTGTDTAMSEEVPAKETSLLPTLLFAFLPDPATRLHLVSPTAVNVDFRAACFCHGRVVDVGYVCSICLSIFCEEGVMEYMRDPAREDGVNGDGDGRGGEVGALRGSAVCLTCSTRLSLRLLGGGEDRPAKKKKKKKARELGDGQGSSMQT